MAPRPPTRIDGYAPIGDYAVVGNKRVAALIALDGSVDWLTASSFDGPSLFAAVLDSRSGGRFALAPTIPFTAERRYLPGTNVLETTFTTTEGSVRLTDAMSLPIARVLRWNELIRRVDGLSGRVPMAWSVEPRFDYGRTAGVPRRHHGVPTFTHDSHVLTINAFDAGEVEQTADAARGRFEATEGSVAVIGCAGFQSEPLTLNTRDGLLHNVDATVEHWRRWLDECSYDGPWRDAVRRSALALDLLVDVDTGAIAAAATTSLPERVGGPRNFDYRYCWLRDMNLTLEAMLRLGYDDQVHASLAWMQAATERTHPRLRPVYRLDGTPRLPERHLDLDGYRGSRPVWHGNPAQSQIQLGNFGDVFDMAWHYVEDGHALDASGGRQLAECVDFLERIWRRPDAGIWELGDQQDYTQSKLACWLTFHRAGQLAETGDLPDAHAGRWHAAAEQVRGYVEQHCWSERQQAWSRSADSDELDAAVLLAARGAFIVEDRERLSSTVDAIRRELGAGGPLVYRYSGMQDQEGAFLACSFWVVEALARAGRHDEAVETMDALVGLANDVGLYSEEIDPSSGEFRGNLPQALTHLALVNAASVCQQLGGG